MHKVAERNGGLMEFPLLACFPEGILWVVGWRIAGRVRVTDSTKQVLRLEFERL